MTIVPQSLFGRLLASAVLFITVALVVAALSIGRVLERFVMQGLDERLDAQITLLARGVDDAGKADVHAVRDVPPFDTPGSGWAWQMELPGQTLRSASLAAGSMPKPLLRPSPRHLSRDLPVYPADGIAASGEKLHFRIAQFMTKGGPVTITAAGPRAIAERPLRQAIMPLIASLVILGIALIAAILFQLRYGLRPLRALETSLSAVRRGAVHGIPTAQPVELRGVVGELNALISENQVGLENARRHVANLAHGLKTPLAALRLKLAETSQDHQPDLLALMGRIDASIAHHLARARAASVGGAARQTTLLAPNVSELVDALRHIHADLDRRVSISIDPGLALACDPQDLAEMLGNLLDNAWRWSSSAVAVAASSTGRMVEITISDDGPGLDEAARRDALVPGRRLDESTPGHGFGLSITRELAELYGGSLVLADAAEGGLAAILTLPRPRG